MKKRTPILVSLLVFLFVMGIPKALAFYNITQSLGFVAASSQYTSRADSGSTGLEGNSTDLTIETWVKFTSLPATDNQMTIASKWDDITGQSYLFRLVDQGGTKKLIFTTTSGSFTQTITTPSTATWYHYAVVYTLAGTSAEFFIDGSSVGSGAAGSVTAGDAAFFMANVGGGQYLNGRLSLMRFWTSARTGTQLSDNKCRILGTTANLSAEWTLNNVLTDNSGNANTLTAVNSPTFGVDNPSVCPQVAASSFNLWQFSNF